jgi:ABC-type transporter Mla MlaB component
VYSTHTAIRELPVPETLGLETRGPFLKAANALLDELPEGAGRLVLDLSTTRHVDSAGLSALMLVQRHAGERRQVVALRRLNDELRFLLVLTKLHDLFEYEDGD